MRDDEIIKAFELCLDTDVRCGECPYAKENRDYLKCAEYVFKDALGLINRQMVEIERLKAEAEMTEGYAEALEQKARKEFAERLSALIEQYETYDTLHTYEILDRIEIILSELTERKEDEK